MFVQVACGKCGKPFQVPEDRLGRPVVCSWCKETVTAVPLAGVEPESLPDEDAPPVPPPPRRKRPWLAPVAIALLSLLSLTFAYFGSRYFRGAVPGFVWQRFDAPDGTCRAELPGAISEMELPANPSSPITKGGKKFTANSMFTRISGFIGWYDLDPTQIELARAEDVLAAERERRKAETGWTIEAESTSAKVGGFSAMEVRLADGSRTYVERYVFVNKGPHPRLYVVGIGGGGFDPDGEAARRVLSSFWFDETK